MTGTAVEQHFEAATRSARTHAEATESSRRLDARVVEALKASGSFRLFVPTQYGGIGLGVLDILKHLRDLSAADGAAGWCAAIASTTSHVAGSVDRAWAEAIFRNPAGVTGGAFAPTGTATRTPDGDLLVNGKWAWGSGSQHCDWLCGGTKDPDGVFRIVFFPAGEANIIDTWQSSGLRGTGSHDFEVAALRVPEGCWSLPVGANVQVDDPLARMPMYTLFAGSIASVMLGIARRAIDEISELALTKRPTGSSKSLIEASSTHVDVGKAEGLWRSATAWLDDEVGQAWTSVVAGDRVSVSRRASVRAAASHASTSARQATDLAYDLGGGTSVYATSPLQRCFRDVHTASAHIMVHMRNTETFGRQLLGQPIETSML